MKRSLLLCALLFVGCAVSRFSNAHLAIPIDAIDKMRLPEGTSCDTVEGEPDWAACDVHNKRVLIHFTRTRVVEAK